MRRLLLLPLLALLSFSALAKKAHDSPVAQIQPQWLIEDDQYSGGLRAGKLSGTPLALSGLQVAVLPGTPEAMARQFLGDNAALLHLQDAGLKDLVYLWSRSGKAGTNVQFEQRIGGVPVYASVIVIHISPKNLVTMVTSGYKSAARLDSVQPLIGAAQARDSVIQYLNAQQPYRFDHTELNAYHTSSGTHLVWHVQLVAAEPIGDWEGLIDAASGEMLAIHDRSSYDTSVPAQGNIFDPDPLSSSHTLYGAPMQDNADADSPELDAQMVLKNDLGNVSFDGSVYTLKNEWAEIVDVEAPNSGLFQQATPAFLFTRDKVAFDAVNTFWHIQDALQYVNNTLGISLHPYQYSGGMQFDPDGLDGEDNSHYVSSTGQIAYGAGCVDDDQDADVIRHELGHGFHDWITNGHLSNEVDGLSEGVGDYYAQSYSRSFKNQWQPSDEQYNWVYSWDGHNECWAGRVTNYAPKWPFGIRADIHTSGQIWSTCMMKIWDALGREKSDAAMLEGLGMTGTLSSQVDAANATYTAAQDMGYSSEELQQMHDIFQGCGYIMAPAIFPIFPLGGGSDAVAAPDDKIAGAQPLARPGKFGGALSLPLLIVLLGARALRRRQPCG
jgi:hypothetical protein